MLQFERQKNILQFLEQHQTSSVKELAKELYVSEASVRRDLEELARNGLVERVYGGVVLAKYKNDVIPVELREQSHAAGKNQVAARAAELIRNGDTVLMDASTTAFRICRYLQGKKNLKIITNNLRICGALAGNGEIKVYCTGGAYSPRNDCFLGAYAEQFLDTVYGDIAFFSAQAINRQGQITDVDETENAIKRKMIRRAKRSVFLCDGSKWDITGPFQICTREQVDEILCDIPLNFEE